MIFTKTLGISKKHSETEMKRQPNAKSPAQCVSLWYKLTEKESSMSNVVRMAHTVVFIEFATVAGIADTIPVIIHNPAILEQESEHIDLVVHVSHKFNVG